MATRVQQDQSSTAHLLRRSCEALGLIGGVWLVVAPFSFAMDFSANDNATWSTVIVGVVAIVAALGSMYERAGSVFSYGVIGLAGIWAVVAPYALTWAGGSGADSALNSIWTGAALIVLALVGYGASMTEETQ